MKILFIYSSWFTATLVGAPTIDDGGEEKKTTHTRFRRTEGLFPLADDV